MEPDANAFKVLHSLLWQKLLHCALYVTATGAQAMARYTQKPQDISKLLSGSSLALQQQQVSVLQQLNKVLAEVLQLEQLSFCQVSSIRDGRAIILCASAPWLTRLKLQRDAILDNFRRKILPDLAGLEIEASPDGQIKRLAVTAAPKLKQPLSEHSAHLLLQSAENTEGAVKQALLKLAQNVASRGQST